MNPDEEIVGKKWDDSFSFLGYPDEIEAREENLKTLHAEMKLCLFLLMWLGVNHIPISRYVFHAAAQIWLKLSITQQRIYQ